MMKHIFCVTTFAILCQPAYALFCPSGFNQIEMGDTIEQVQRQCGKPDVKTEEKSDTKSPQQWQYYVKPDPTNASTLNVTVAFTGGKVINITVNGTSLVTTPICGRSISTGDTMDQVKAACGDASFITKGATSGAAETTITQFKYNTAPPVVFTFENGKLIKRK